MKNSKILLFVDYIRFDPQSFYCYIFSFDFLFIVFNFLLEFDLI